MRFPARNDIEAHWRFWSSLLKSWDSLCFKVATGLSVTPLLGYRIFFLSQSHYPHYSLMKINSITAPKLAAARVHFSITPQLQADGRAATHLGMWSSWWVEVGLLILLLLRPL